MKTNLSEHLSGDILGEGVMTVFGYLDRSVKGRESGFLIWPTLLFFFSKYFSKFRKNYSEICIRNATNCTRSHLMQKNGTYVIYLQTEPS